MSWVLGLLFISAGYGVVYFLAPGGSARPISQWRSQLGGASIGLLGLGICISGLAHSRAQTGLFVLWVLMLSASGWVLLGPFLRPAGSGRPVSDRKRGTLRYDWARVEAWSKVCVGVFGGFGLFVTSSLFWPVALPQLGVSLPLALAISILSGVLLWAFILGWSLFPKSHLRAWGVVLFSMAMLGLVVIGIEGGYGL